LAGKHPISKRLPQGRHDREVLPHADAIGEKEMTDTEYARKLDELDRLLNDPDVPMEPAKVWSLLAEIAQRDMSVGYAKQTQA
jgi:hypothetical protein